MKDIILEMQGIHKSFPGVKALDNVSLKLGKGEVLALVGENGAGKSTLMKILSGAYKQDSGKIILEGKALNHYTPSEAIEMGISIIYQELSELSTLSIAENIFVGRLPIKRGLVDRKELYRLTRTRLEQVGMGDLDPFDSVESLSVGKRQLLEIARAFARNAKIIVMDEPTASLTEREVELLYEIIRDFRSNGGSIILITHKLPEVFAVADHVSVLRDGKNAADWPISEIETSDIVREMVGREIKDMYPTGNHTPGEVILKVDKLNSEMLSDISFELRAGEILGFYGLMGSGCEDIGPCIFGAKPVKSMNCTIAGMAAQMKDPSDRLKEGISFVPSERKADGLMLNQSIRANITLSTLKNLSSKGLLHLKEEKKTAATWKDKLQIKAPDIEADVENLSGGNQQKVVFAKALNSTPRIILMNEPTRGVDVGAKAEIYALMEQFCSDGVGIIMQSSELPETMAISDRVIVIREGRIAAEFAKGTYTQADVMQAMVGEPN